MKRLGELFWAFFRIGALTFGGGYAMIALLDHECVEKRQWLTADELMDITVVAESTPGPIAINCATYTGWRQAGLAGAVSATVGIVLPAFLLFWGLSFCFEELLDLPVLEWAFRGIRAAVAVLVLEAGAKMLLKLRKKPQGRSLRTGLGSCGHLVCAAGPGTGLAHLHHRTDAARRDRRCAALPGDPRRKGGREPMMELFWAFLKIGAFAFGGAYGAIPLIRDTVLSHGWMDAQMFANLTAVAESTPGPIMVNLATYVGAAEAGLPGALAATLGVVLPSFVLILLVSAAFRSLLGYPAVRQRSRASSPVWPG